MGRHKERGGKQVKDMLRNFTEERFEFRTKRLQRVTINQWPGEVWTLIYCVVAHFKKKNTITTTLFDLNKKMS